MGNTINALKRNRKKYQEGGEVLSPEELMRQAGQEVMDMYAAEQDAKNNEVQPALLEQNQETPAGPPLGVPVVNAAPTSLLETPADPAPAAPAAPEAVAIQPFSPQNQSLENYIKETGAEVTSELLKQSIDYLNAVGSRGETFQRNKYQKENPELYYAAYPEERPFDGTETLSQFKERTGSSQVTAEMLQQRINLLDKNLDKRYRDTFKKEAKEQYPDAYAQAFPAEAAAEPIATADGVRPFSAENESLENYLRETGTELTAELIKQNIDYLVSTNSRGEPYQREKFLKENPDLYYAAFPEERPFDAASETLDNYIETTGNTATPELILQAIEHAEKTISPQGASSFVNSLEQKYPDAFYEVYPDRMPIPAYDARNDLNEYLNQNQLDVNPELIKSRITYLESESPEAVANTKKDFLAAYPNVYFQAFPNEAPGNRQFNPGDSKPLINEPNYWIGKGENFNTLYSDPVKGPLLRENFNKDLLNWELAQGYRTLEAPLYSYEKGDEQPNPSFFTSIEDFNAAKYYYEKAGNKYKEPVKETTEQSYYTSIENPNNIDINSQVEQRDFNPSFGTLLPQKNLTEADFNPTGKGKFTFNKGDFPPIPAQYRNEEAYLQAVQSYNQVVSAEISDDTVERYSSALDVYESADNIENSMEWIMLKDTLFLNYPVFVTGALQSQTRKGDPKPTLATHRSLTPEDFLNTLREWEQNNAAPEELPETDEAEILRQQAIKEEEEKRAAELRQQAEENYVFEPEEVLKGLPLTDDGFIDVSEESLFSDEFAPYRNEVNYNKKIQNEMGWANFTADSPQPLPSDFASVNNYITASLKWNMVQQAKKDFGPDVVIAKSPSDVVYNEWGSVVVDETLGTAENPLPPTGTLADMPLWVSGDVYAKYRNPGEYNPLSTAGGNQYDNYKELVDNLAIWNLDEVAHYERRAQEREQREINNQAAKERREKNAQLQDNLLDPVTDVDGPVTDVDDPVTDVDVPVTDVDVPVDTGEDVDVPVDTDTDVDVPVTDVDVPVDTGGDSLLDQQPADSQYGPDDNWLGLDPIQALKASIGLPVEGIGEDFDRLNLSPEDQIRMDINGDGRVTSSDANWILLNYYESGVLKDFVLGLSENDKEMLREPLAMVTDDVTEYGLSAEPPVDTGEDVDVPVDTGEDVDVPVTDVDVPVDTGEDSLLEYQPPEYFKGDSPPSINQFRDPRLPLDAFDRALDAYIEAQDFQLGDDRPVREDSLIDSVYDRILDAWYAAGNTDAPVDTVTPVLSPEIPTGVPPGYQAPEYKYGDAPPAVPPAVSEEAYAINYAAWQAVQDAGPVDPVTDVDVPVDTDTDVDVPVDTDTDINPDDYDNDDDLIDAINDNLDSDVSQKPEGSTDVLRPMDESDIETTLSEISLDPNKIDNGEMSWGSAIDEADAFKEEYRVKATDLYNEYLPFISGEISDIPSALIPVENPGPNPHVEVFNDPYAYAEHQHKIANYKMYLYEQALYDNAVALYNERTGTTTSPEDTPEGTPQLDASDYSGEVSALEGIFSGKEYEGEMVLKYTPQLQDLYDKYTPYITGDTFSDIPPAMSQENPPPNPGTIYDESRYSTEELKSMLMQKAEYQLWEYEKELYDNAVAFYNERQGINPDDYDNDDDLIDAINDNIDSDGANQMSETTRTETSSNVTLEFKDAAGAPRELKYKNPLVTTPPSMSASDVDTGEDSKTTTADTAIQAVGTGDDVADATATGATATKIGDADTGLPALQGEIKTTDKVSGPGIDNTPTGGNYTAETIGTAASATAATGTAPTAATATGPTASSITAAARDTDAETAATATAATQSLSAGSVATAATAFDSVRNTKSFEALTGIAETRREAMEADPEYIEALDTLSGEELQAKLQDIPSVKSYLRAESTMLKMLENAGAKKIAEVEGPQVSSTYTASTISSEDLLELTEIAKDRGVDITDLNDYKILKVRTAQTAVAATGTATSLAGAAPTAEAATAAQVEATAIEMAGTTTIEDTPEYKKAAERTAQTAEAATGTASEINLTGTSVDFEERKAITGTAPQGTAAEIGGVPTFEASQMQATTAEARTLNATEMLAITASLPEETAAAIAQDPASVEAVIDSGEDPKVTAAVAALPPEALVSAQMETLLAGMEDGETPAWARPAVDAVDAAMARRGLSASTVGRDALFNAIIQSALPMAQSNAQALQARAAQNLGNQQQASLAQAQNIMTIRMQNLANSQLSASQSAQMAQEIAVKQSTFDQQAAMLSAEQEQQTALLNTQNAQRAAEVNAQQKQQAAIAQFTEASKLDYQNLQALNSASAANLNAEQQAKLKSYDAQVARLMRQADLNQDMEKANLSASLTVEMQNLTEQNAAARDTMSATNQERLTNLQTLVDLRKTNATLAQQMDVANLTNEQQIELAVLQDKAATDSANFTADNQFRLTELNNKVARSVRQAELDQRVAEINLDASLKLELTELSEMNATNRANMSAEQQTRLANLNSLIDFKKTNATLTQQMELANLSNEQQVSIANLTEAASADSQTFTESNRFELQRLTTAAQVLSSNEQLRMNADMARLSTEERVSLANLTAKNQFDAASMSAENTAELQRYEKQMGAAQVNAQLAQQMGIAELSNAQQAAMFNAQVNSNLDFKTFDANQQVALANSAFMQTMTVTEFNAEQQAAIQNATMLTQVNLAGADQATKLAVTNASNFLQMDMANLSNKQQVAVLNTQIEQQKLINNVSAKNAAAQFGAANQQQADLFMANLGVEIEKYNASATIAREQFNATEKNRQAAINAGNELEASRLTAQLATDISKFNSQQDLAREQWNAANAQAVEQSNVQWRRQANLADTAAQNAANQQNAQIAFNLTSQEQTQLWQQMRDDAAYIRQSYENKEQRNAQLLATAIGNDTVTKNVATYNTLLGIED